MRGIVFTEFLDMVEARHSLAVVDAVIARAGIASGGAYTAVGNYPAAEMHALVGALAAETGTSTSGLLEAFGEHLAITFAAGYPQMFAIHRTAMEFLCRVEGYIHIQVRSLYPDAELPSFEVVERTDDRVVMVYRSPRAMSALAIGLIRGVGLHFGEPLAVTAEPLAVDGSAVRLVITRVAA